MKAQYWFDEIKEAEKREKDFRKNGEEILGIYEGKKTPFNILYSNTETLLPALFSELPRPVISRRHKDPDPLAKVVSDAGQRMISYLLDTDLDEYDNFTNAVTDVTLDALLPGRGNASIEYDADDDVSYETVCVNTHPWERIHYGYAKKWSKMPWIAYEYYLDKEEAKEKFKNIKGIVFKEGEEDENEDEGTNKTAKFYQIWYKRNRTVYWICEQVKDRYLDEIDDPLELSGFYNCPKPLQFVKKPSDLVPTALYTLYENQAGELNKIQLRINKLVEAIKVRGIYDQSLGTELGSLFEDSDNSLTPTDKGSSLIDGGFDKAIWFAPIEKLISVLQQLFQARESCKAVIYEITGISDIVRGQSVASETLGAQKIKESWGTMRLKRLQKEVQRYALDMMKMMLEIAAMKFSEDTWKKITMLPNPTSKEKKEAEKQLQAMQAQHQQQMQMIQQQAMQQGQGQPPHQAPQQPFNPPPELLQAVQSPSFGDILKVLNDDFMRSYRIDIETNSTLDVEATEDKQMVGEFMNALAQVMSGFANDQTIPFEGKKEIILAVTKRFRFGREVEDALNSMQEPQPQIPPEIQQQIQQQQQQLQQGQQQIQQEQKKLQQEKQKIEAERMQFDFDRVLAEKQLEMDKKLASEQLKFEETMMEARIDNDKAEAESKLKEIIAKSQRDTQSMLDKHTATVKECTGAKTESPKIEIINQIPDGNKSISIKRENGEITGAEVE